jgi:DNA polymerase-1
MNPLVFVDFSNIARSCWHPAEAAVKANPGKYVIEEVFKNNLVAKMDTIEKHTGVEAGRYIMAVDDRCQWRYELFPEYKGNRDRSGVDPRPLARQYLAAVYPMRWASAPGAEADDVIAAMVRVGVKQGREMVVVSGDKDLWQLLGQPGVKVFLPTKKVFVTPEMVLEEYGCGPSHIRLAKALWGDPSDNMPNCLPRQQKQFMPHILASNGTLPDMLAVAILGGLSEKAKALMDQNIKQVGINYSLATLKDDVLVKFDPVG